MTAHEQCEACGFDGASFDDDELLDTICALGPRWSALLDSAGAELRTRPAPEVWSAVEYAAHSRDITTLHVFGVEQALTGDEPVFPAIAADEMISAAATDYGTADPDEVATELARQATLLADTAASAGSEAWSRGLTIGDERSDVRALLEHGLHDSLHHLADVERGLALLRTQKAGEIQAKVGRVRG